jgi:hypothetical protein
VRKKERITGTTQTNLINKIFIDGKAAPARFPCDKKGKLQTQLAKNQWFKFAFHERKTPRYL